MRSSEAASVTDAVSCFSAGSVPVGSDAPPQDDTSKDVKRRMDIHDVFFIAKSSFLLFLLIDY
jgi:hypothetical protein